MSDSPPPVCAYFGSDGGCAVPSHRGVDRRDNPKGLPLPRRRFGVIQGQMATTFGSASDVITGVGTSDTVDSTTPVEVASIVVTPKAEANANLNAHAPLEVRTNDEGRYDIEIRSGDCNGA